MAFSDSSASLSFHLLENQHTLNWTTFQTKLKWVVALIVNDACGTNALDCSVFTRIIPVSPDLVQVNCPLYPMFYATVSRFDVQFAVFMQGYNDDQLKVSKMVLIDSLWRGFTQVELYTGYKIAYLEPPINKTTALEAFLVQWMLVISLILVISFLILGTIAMQFFEKQRMSYSFKNRPTGPRAEQRRNAVIGDGSIDLAQFNDLSSVVSRPYSQASESFAQPRRGSLIVQTHRKLPYGTTVYTSNGTDRYNYPHYLGSSTQGTTTTLFTHSRPRHFN